MLKNFTYSFPTKIVYGINSIQQLSILLKIHKINKAMMVYGKKSIFENGIYQSVVEQFNKASVPFVEYGGCNQNPDINFVEKGVEISLLEKIDFIFAIGGGSVIDASKAIALFSKNNSNNLWQKITSQEKIENNALPIGVVLTAIGTGSEGNGSFIISNNKTGEKIGKADLSTRPIFSICDPGYTLTLGKMQTAYGCVDIASHLLEQYFCQEKESILDDIIIATLKNVIKNSLEVKNNPNNIESRAELMIASTFSLSYILSLGKTLDWSTHKIEHAISGVYGNVAHAAGLACLLPSWMNCASKNEVFYNKIILLGEKLEINSDDIYGGDLKNNVINYFKKFFIDMGLETSLEKLIGFYPDIVKVADIAMKYGNIGKVYEINRQECIKIIKASV